MLYYNVSFDLSNISNKLITSITSSAADDEDKTTPRICLTDSVEHCMQAIAVGNRNIAVGSNFILKVVNIPRTSKDLIKPEELKRTNKVPDALENNEYWYLKSINCDVYYCVITNLSFEHTIAWSCITAEQCRKAIYKHCTKLKLERYTSALSMYNAFIRWSKRYDLWDLQDDVWDEIEMIPWAQKVKINKIEFKKIDISSKYNRVYVVTYIDSLGCVNKKEVKARNERESIEIFSRQNPLFSILDTDLKTCGLEERFCLNCNNAVCCIQGYNVAIKKH